MSSLIEDERANRFNRRVRLIGSAGIEFPKEFVALRQRLADFRADAGTPVRDRIVAAIVAGDADADLPLLRAVALAEATTDNFVRSELESAIAAGVHEHLRNLYGTKARTNYEQLQTQFNTEANAFTKAANTIDPEMSPIEVLDGTDAEQRAWKAAEVAAKRMAQLLPALAAAATLAGFGDDTNPDEQLALAVDVADHDRQALWAAWDIEETERVALSQAAAGDMFSRPTVTPSRCGRWSALHRLGCTIRATPLEDYEPYGRREPVFQPEHNGDPFAVGELHPGAVV